MSDFDTYISDDEGQEYPDTCSVRDCKGTEDDCTLIECFECRALLCPDHYVTDDGSKYCTPCYRLLPDVEDGPAEAYDPQPLGRWETS